MSGLTLYHGTPEAFESHELEKRHSFFHAIWVSTSEDVAAIYAGPGGYIHTMELDPNAVLLRACGTKENGAWTYPSRIEWDLLVAQLERRRVNVEAFESIDPDKAGSSWPPLGPEGQPSWEGILDDFCDIPGDAESILMEMGVHAVARTERLELSLGDRSNVIRENVDPSYAALVNAAKRNWRKTAIAVAVFEPAVLLPVHRTSSKPSTWPSFQSRATIADMIRLHGRYQVPKADQSPAMSRLA